MLDQDSIMHYTSIWTRQKLRELGYEIFIHPPCSSDLAPIDYYLFLSMTDYFAGENFASLMKIDCLSFANRDRVFYKSGIIEKVCVFVLNWIILTMINKNL